MIEAEWDGGSLLLDTHVLLWLIEGYGSLGSRARYAIDQATLADCAQVSAITPWEIALLVSKKRLALELDVQEWIERALHSPGLSLTPLEPAIAVASTRFPFEMQADPADRILLATARHLPATLVTADRLLLGLAEAGHLRAIDATL